MKFDFDNHEDEMGQFLNPSNINFSDEKAKDIYVDKTGLIKYTNRVMNTTNKYIICSPPRRFGKSYTAHMLTAYYSKKQLLIRLKTENIPNQ